MISSFLGACLVVFGRGAYQQNPPGTSVYPSQAAFFSSSGATALVEIRNSQGQVVPFVDQTGAKWGSATVSFPSGVAVGLGWEITQTVSPGSSAFSAVGSGQYSAVVRFLTGTATEAPAGTYDSSAGAGNGIAAGQVAPSVTTPSLFATGVPYQIGYGGLVSALEAPSPNPFGLALTDIGGSGCTVGLEARDWAGVVVPFVDTNGVSWSALTLAIGASGSVGAAYAILHTSPDSSHPIDALPVGVFSVGLRCLSGASGIPTLAINYGGIAYGSAGTGGSGFNSGFAPNSSSPVQYFVLDSGSFGRIR